jgi:hypothetical protein
MHRPSLPSAEFTNEPQRKKQRLTKDNIAHSSPQHMELDPEELNTRPLFTSDVLLTVYATTKTETGFCVATFDVKGTLKRPMQKHEPEKDCKVYHWINDFEIGKQYVFRRSITYRTEYPHATEDHFVSDGKSSDNQELCSLYDQMKSKVHIDDTINTACSPYLNQTSGGKGFVLEGAECRSLFIVQAKGHQLTFYKNQKNHLRCLFRDVDSRIYDLAVTCTKINAMENPIFEGDLLLCFGFSRGMRWPNMADDLRRCSLMLIGAITQHY